MLPYIIMLVALPWESMLTCNCLFLGLMGFLRLMTVYLIPLNCKQGPFPKVSQQCLSGVVYVHAMGLVVYIGK